MKELLTRRYVDVGGCVRVRVGVRVRCFVVTGVRVRVRVRLGVRVRVRVREICRVRFFLGLG